MKDNGMAMDPQLMTVLTELVRLLRQPAGGGASPFAAPMESGPMRAMDQRTGKVLPLIRDPASLGLKLWSDWPERYCISQGLMAASTAVLYTATEDWKDCLLQVCLIDTAERTFQVQHVTDGTAANKHHIFSVGTKLPVGHPGYTYTGFGLKSGEFLQGHCSNANGVSWKLYGLRNTGAV